MEHTPGPWKAIWEEHAGYDCMTSGWCITQEEALRDLVVVDEGDYRDKGEAQANARLIAAAPLLLRDLEMAVELADAVIKDLGSEDWRIPFARDSWKATIAKATGI